MKIQVVMLLFILLSISVAGQTEMLIGQISGKFIIRENFNKEGEFINKQTSESREVIKKNGYFEIKVVTELFDKDKKPTDKYLTTYRCKPDDASIMVMAIPFSSPKSKETEINTTSINFKEIYDLKNLENIELEINFDSGVLNFFGSKSKIKIYDRELEVSQSYNNIKSKINIKVYAIGIRIKQLNYTVHEKLNDKGILTFQKFTEKDGSFFTMTYKQIKDEKL